MEVNQLMALKKVNSGAVFGFRDGSVSFALSFEHPFEKRKKGWMSEFQAAGRRDPEKGSEAFNISNTIVTTTYASKIGLMYSPTTRFSHCVKS